MRQGPGDSVAANLPDGAVAVTVEAGSRIAVHLWSDHDDVTCALTALRR
jgi:hypothetical protein